MFYTERLTFLKKLINIIFTRFNFEKKPQANQHFSSKCYCRKLGPKSSFYGIEVRPHESNRNDTQADIFVQITFKKLPKDD